MIRTRLAARLPCARGSANPAVAERIARIGADVGVDHPAAQRAFELEARFLEYARGRGTGQPFPLHPVEETL